MAGWESIAVVVVAVVVVVIVVAAWAPSQAVVSTMKEPFLSWHLHTHPTPTRQQNSHSVNNYIHFNEADNSEDNQDMLTFETISAPANIW